MLDSEVIYRKGEKMDKLIFWVTMATMVINAILTMVLICSSNRPIIFFAFLLSIVVSMSSVTLHIIFENR